MQHDRDPRPSSGVGRRSPRRADRSGGAAPPRPRRRPIPAPMLVWLLTAALLTAPAALALAVTAGAPVAAASGVRSEGPPAAPPTGPASSARAVPTAGPAPTARVPALRPPVVGPLVRGYEAPAGRFGPGHRGVDLAAAPGAAVGAPASGRVAFAGGVAGTTWVSIEVAPGVLVTLGPLRALAVGGGQRVGAGTRLADLAPGHAGAWHSTTLHLGLRVDGEYVDPLPWLTGFGRPRLAPLLEPGGPH